MAASSGKKSERESLKRLLRRPQRTWVEPHGQEGDAEIGASPHIEGLALQRLKVCLQSLFGAARVGQGGAELVPEGVVLGQLARG